MWQLVRMMTVNWIFWLKNWRDIVCVAVIQETKWFGKDILPAVDGHMFLHSCDPLPEGDGIPHRGEGVGSFLNSVASEAWRQANEIWKAIS